MRGAARACTATAAVLGGLGQPLEMRELVVDPPGDGDVVVRVEHGGVCGTDLHIQQGRLPVPLPLVLGHEGIGVVESVGPRAVDVDGSAPRVGERVMWVSSISCGSCWHCRVAREPTLCVDRRTYGVNRALDETGGPGGSWSERMLLVEGTAIVPVPDGVDSIDAMALACAGPTVLHALDERRPVRLGETVVVQGSGPVGLAAALYAQLSGAEKVILVGAPRSRLDAAQGLGIGHEHLDIADFSDRGVADAVLPLTPGHRGADLVIECTGVPAAVEDGLRMCRRGGSYLVLGQYTDAGPAAINPHTIVYRQLDVRGSWGFTGAHLERYVRSLPMLVPRHAIRELVTSFALADANEALAAVGAGTVVKAVLSPASSPTASRQRAGAAVAWPE
jgi:threonine dehydrogenase-like Zn-dependent dehydrogenase